MIAVIFPTLSAFGIVYVLKILFNEVLLRFWEGVKLDASIQSVLCPQFIIIFNDFIYMFFLTCSKECKTGTLTHLHLRCQAS